MKNAELRKGVLAILEGAAVTGERCPTNPEIASALARTGRPVAASSVPRVISDLIRDGKIEVTYFNQKARTVTLCEGPNAGRTTSLPLTYTTPAWVIDRKERQRRDVASNEKKNDRAGRRTDVTRPVVP